MRIGVLTFHRCINYGSYWQARCLVDGLRARGHDAVLLDHDSRSVRQAEWRCAFQPQLPRRTERRDLGRYGEKARRFLRAFERLPRSHCFPLEMPALAGDYDLVLVGSDEVWNFRHPWYSAKPIFFGEGLRAGRLAAYAASFGNHDANDGIDASWTERLGAFDAISVRDDNSRALLAGALGEAPEVVLDPCLQFPPPPTDEPPRREVAVYGHSFPAWFASAARTWAEKAGYRLVSVGYRNDWADEQRIEAGPDDFRRLIAASAAVVTNFFHGCVFALVNAKPFACVASDYRSIKLRDLTRRLGAEHRLVEADAAPGRIGELLATPLAAHLADRIREARQRSDRFLDLALGEA
ncbi:polysaccharide pyruvyl transferase family protein [Sphingomonas cannabina]|uniref:polysaccharide pyruvyl transferase family protein n=1 Tax=Sphingomonas cannabina TaxID=2899123 RepID=UPI001F33357E|nr:polysaccharide pyruvyl transferase family protein [Sphingomonas cannabina]UIJ45057.1 polysaccharide pyruvyl transferase family protein [Sphingomonas cannabina]